MTDDELIAALARKRAIDLEMGRAPLDRPLGSLPPGERAQADALAVERAECDRAIRAGLRDRGGVFRHGDRSYVITFDGLNVATYEPATARPDLGGSVRYLAHTLTDKEFAAAAAQSARRHPRRAAC